MRPRTDTSFDSKLESEKTLPPTILWLSLSLVALMGTSTLSTVMDRDSERLILMEVQQCDIHNIYIIYIYTRYTRIVANIRIHIFRLHENNHISDTDMMLNQERLEMPKIFHKWSWDMGACFHILAFPLITLIIAWVGERPGVWASKNRGYHVLSLWQWARLVWDPMAKAGREVKTRNDLFSRSQRPLI